MHCKAAVSTSALSGGGGVEEGEVQTGLAAECGTWLTCMGPLPAAVQPVHQVRPCVVCTLVCSQSALCVQPAPVQQCCECMCMYNNNWPALPGVSTEQQVPPGTFWRWGGLRVFETEIHQQLCPLVCGLCRVSAACGQVLRVDN